MLIKKVKIQEIKILGLRPWGDDWRTRPRRARSRHREGVLSQSSGVFFFNLKKDVNFSYILEVYCISFYGLKAIIFNAKWILKWRTF